AEGHAPSPHAVRRLGARRAEPCLPQVGAEPLAPARAVREAAGEQPAAQGGVALHPQLRGLVDRPEFAVLRRTADGRRVPGHLRRRPPPREGNGRPLDAARADVGRGARLSDARLLAVAEHCTLVRLDLAFGLRSPWKGAVRAWRSHGPTDSTD